MCHAVLSLQTRNVGLLRCWRGIVQNTVDHLVSYFWQERPADADGAVDAAAEAVSEIVLDDDGEPGDGEGRCLGHAARLQVPSATAQNRGDLLGPPVLSFSQCRLC